MLELKQICKDYVTGEIVTHALKDVSVQFRNSEFVSILGPSGCGKTTLLNIVGGLDRYTSGDLIINGKSTTEYRDADWDTYRNHTIGFVFQNYNLIMHINVESNVELALTLSGISEKERKERTREVLERVGLADKAKSLPNQLSGGQMQRVAIARALINNPDILLADEPTGALDSETSVQIMQLLKEIGNEKLVIMVTHNPELAQEYSTRIINIKDGEIISDTNPVVETVEAMPTRDDLKKKSMNFGTALKLSGNNLRTKLTRTILVAIAGSIGIIGIALILSMSHGFKTYIDTTEENALSEYPLTISESSTDMSVYSAIIKRSMDATVYDDGQLHVNNILSDSAKLIQESSTQNDLSSFKTYLENNHEIDKYVLDIKYSYSAKFYVYTNELDEKGTYNHALTYPIQGISFGNWMELIDNDEHLNKKYSLVTGSWPKEANEVMVFLDANGQISDMVLYMLGLRDATELANLLLGNEVEETDEIYQYEDILGLDLKYLINSDYFYKKNAEDDYYSYVSYKSTIPAEMAEVYKIVDKIDRHLKIVGIAQPKDKNSMTSYLGGVGYTRALVNKIVEINNSAPATTMQLANPEICIRKNGATWEDAGTTLEEELKKLGYNDIDHPKEIYIYPKSFDDKDKVVEYIDNYNKQAPEEQKIKYSDDVAVMVSSVDTILNAVTYVLIAFVSVSLVVSSIMIGVITYISVLERTKEIGVLRSIGASKKDIRRVFNAETLIIGFASGIIGVSVSLLLLIPINIIIKHFTQIPNMGILPWQGGIALVFISMGLTLIAGLIPSGFAAKRDPVVALRSE